MKSHTAFGYAATKRLPLLAILTFLLFGIVQEGYGQDQVRKYATRQRAFTTLLLNSVTNNQLATDGNPQTASNLNILISTLNVGPEQVLDFNPDPDTSDGYSTYIPGNTPITVKFATPAGLLALDLTYEIQAIKDLRDRGFVGGGWGYDDVGPVFSGDISLLSLLGGAGDNEVTIIPGQDYQGIRVKVFSSVLGAVASAGIYDAYIMEASPQPLDCEERNKAIDVLSGTRSEGLDALETLGGVTNPYNAINGNVTDYATMAVGVGALNTIYLNTIFQTPSQSGQKLRIILERPGSILDLGLLSQFSIQPYLRNQPAGPPLAASSPLLNLRLLPGTNKYELAYDIDEVFDRVELRFDNTVTVLTSLRVYEVSRLPRIMLIEDPSMLNESLTNCGQVDLSAAIANYQPDHYTYNYYTEPSGGTALSTSIVTSSGEYYIEAVDPVTGCASDRVEVTATVHPLPTFIVSPISSICEGEDSVTIPLDDLSIVEYGFNIVWENESELDEINIEKLPDTNIIAITGLNDKPAGTYKGHLTIIDLEIGCESIPREFEFTITDVPGRAHVSIGTVEP